KKEKTVNGGRFVTSEDVRYSFERCIRIGKRAWVFDSLVGSREFMEGKTNSVAGIQIISPHTIMLKLKQPFTPFLTVLCMPNAAIVPKEDVENKKRNFEEFPVGTGAFYIVENRDKVKIVLERNDNYFLQKAKVKKVILPIINDENARWMAFLNGDIYHSDITNPKYQTTKQDPKWKNYIQELSQWGTYYMGMNVTKPPFDNKLIRQAFNYAINRKEICQVMLNDRVIPAKGVLPPGIKGYNKDLIGYTYNLEKAEELLKKAGYANGNGFPEITLQYNEDKDHKRVAEYIQSNLIDLGIKVKLKVVDWPTHISMLDRGEIPFFRLGWVADYPDPDNFTYVLFHSSHHGSKGNQTFFDNPRVDRLLEDGRSETDPKKRIKLYQEAEKIIVEEAPWLFVYHSTAHVIHQKWVKGLKLTPMGRSAIKFNKLWIDTGN
ncbi:ABC transporter substrate-binding protein, partial [Candidatus Riflebacteria bacterium]